MVKFRLKAIRLEMNFGIMGGIPKELNSLSMHLSRRKKALIKKA